jgi:hypothetical protein
MPLSRKETRGVATLAQWQIEEIEKGIEEAERDEFASDKEVEEVLNRWTRGHPKGNYRRSRRIFMLLTMRHAVIRLATLQSQGFKHAFMAERWFLVWLLFGRLSLRTFQLSQARFLFLAHGLRVYAPSRWTEFLLANFSALSP